MTKNFFVQAGKPLGLALCNKNNKIIYLVLPAEPVATSLGTNSVSPVRCVSCVLSSLLFVFFFLLSLPLRPLQ